jgi:SAM-dependent methyltransferase
MSIDYISQAISYKDPAGFVKKTEGIFYRYINNLYAKEYQHLMNSGLYQELMKANLLIEHKEIATNEDFYKVILPKQLYFLSYPPEWTFDQWQKMLYALLTINCIALQYGMILKDASPYNFTFVEGKCLLLDTISFRFYNNGEPWFAYRQFCEEVLAPMALIYFKSAYWAKLSLTSIKGFQLSFVSKQLPFKTWFNSTCLLHIHLHSKFVSNKSSNKAISHFNTEKLLNLFNTINKNVAAWRNPVQEQSVWNNYYIKNIESQIYLQNKEDVIRKWLQLVKPSSVADLGANTGLFSTIASEYCDNVAAVESDVVCVAKIISQNKHIKKNNITTFVADITEPTPGLGWENTEKIPLLERLSCEMVLLLAVIHHLAIAKNVPLPLIASLANKLTTNYVIVEFVPKSDNKVKQLLSSKADIFFSYNENHFIDCFSEYFSLIEAHKCEDSERKLFLWQKK